MPDRQFSAANGYRFGFNGKENDNEVKNVGNQQDYGFRIYDPRLARFLSIDPLTKSYPWYTPYQFAGNKPIWAADLDGAEEIPGDILQKAMRMGANYIKQKTEKAVEVTINTVIDLGKKKIEQKLEEKVNSQDPKTTSLALTTEFVFGIGPQERDFGPDHPFTKSLKGSNLTTEALKAFDIGYEDYKAGKRPDVPQNYRVDFDYLFNGNTGPIKEFRNDGEFTAAQFTGTANYVFDLDEKNQVLNITVYDTKNEYSFLYHAPGTDRHSRQQNPFMGETTQTYGFSMPLTELKKRTSEEKRK